jgi:hypothetical protein
MALLRRTGIGLQASKGYLECWFLLPASHPIRSGHEFCYRHSEAPIDQIPSIFLGNDNIVLLPQVADDLVDRGGRDCISKPLCGVGASVGRHRTSLRNLPGATDPEALHLL